MNQNSTIGQYQEDDIPVFFQNCKEKHQLEDDSETPEFIKPKLPDENDDSDNWNRTNSIDEPDPFQENNQKLGSQECQKQKEENLQNQTTLHELSEAYQKLKKKAQHPEEHIFILQKGASEKNPTSFFFLGNVYFYGYSVKIDFHKAQINYEKALKFGDISPKKNLLKLYVMTNQLEKANSLVQEFIHDHDPQSQYSIAEYYKKRGDMDKYQSIVDEMFQSNNQDPLFWEKLGHAFLIKKYLGVNLQNAKICAEKIKTIALTEKAQNSSKSNSYFKIYRHMCISIHKKEKEGEHMNEIEEEE